MEPDRYQYNHKLYVIGITCLILALGLILYSFYILPFLLWELHYDVPEFVAKTLALFEDKYRISVEGICFYLWRKLSLSHCWLQCYLL